MTAPGGSRGPDPERAALVTVRCTVEPHNAATLRIHVTAWPRIDVGLDADDGAGAGAEFEVSVHATVEGALESIASYLRTFAADADPPTS